MRLEITRLEGLRNDLLLRIERDEIEEALLSVANRDRLMRLPGMPRHRQASEAEARGMAEAKVPLEAHLASLGVVDQAGRARRRAVAISNRNLGTNHGHVAWQRGERPAILRVSEDPVDYGVHSCLVARQGGGLSIEDLRFDVAAGRAYRQNGDAIDDGVEWATFGQQVLRRGQVVRVEEIIGQFYDARHVLAFDHHRDEGARIRREIYRDYPSGYGARLLDAWKRQGVPRSRYVHNAIGLSAEAVVVVQREGTIEEVGAALRGAGAEDGLILDNGGSVACWAWWANLYAGGILSPTIDYRPPGTSAIAFVLKGPVHVDLPGGSVSYSVA
jgi:hypothetical protein